MHNLIFVSLFLFSFVCSQGDNKTNLSDKHTSGDLKDYQAIVPAREKMEWAFGRNYKPYDPTLEDIQTAEEVLLACYNKEVTGTENPFFGKKLEDYNRQFIGAEIEGGDKVILINCFCKAQSETLNKWKTELVLVADGGNCFFHVNVNLKRKAYYGLMVNGYAVIYKDYLNNLL